MNQLTSKNTLLFSTGGAPAETDVITTDNNVFVNPKAKQLDYKDLGNGALGNNKTLVNDDFVTTDFTVDVKAKSSGAAGTAPTLAELFKACGLAETVTAGISVAYAPTSTFVQGTAAAYLDGAKRDVTGIAGTFSFSGKIGEIPKFSFSLKGFTDLEETAEVNPAVTLDPNLNFIVKSVTAITVGGAEIDLQDFDFSMNCDIKENYALNIKEFYIADYKPSVKVNAVKTKGNFAHWTELKTNTKKVLVITLGGGAGETLTFTAPYCAPVDVSENDGDGKVVYARTWNCENSVGNDNFEIKYS